MVNKPLIRPYFWGGYVRAGGRLTSHNGWLGRRTKKSHSDSLSLSLWFVQLATLSNFFHLLYHPVIQQFEKNFWIWMTDTLLLDAHIYITCNLLTQVFYHFIKSKNPPDVWHIFAAWHWRSNNYLNLGLNGSIRSPSPAAVAAVGGDVRGCPPWHVKELFRATKPVC